MIYILLFPLYLSKENSLEIRKLDSLQIISMELFGKGNYQYISTNSKLMPKYISSLNQTFINYQKRTF